MAQRSKHDLGPGIGEDYLDDAITRFGAQKTSTGLVLSRAFRAIHHRFLALGSAIAGLVAAHEDTAQRHQQRINDHRAELDDHAAILPDHEDRLNTLRQRIDAATIGGEDARLVALQVRCSALELATRGWDETRIKVLESRVSALEQLLNDDTSSATDDLIRLALRESHDRAAAARMLLGASMLLEPVKVTIPSKAQEPSK